MSTPHEYFDEHGRIELKAKGETALYEDPDYLSNESHDGLPIASTVGRGPIGKGIEVTKDENDAQGKSKLTIKDDKLHETILTTTNLHAGILRIEVEEDYDDMDVEGAEDKHKFVKMFLKRDGVEKLIAETEVPVGADGTRMLVAHPASPYVLDDDYSAIVPNSDLAYQGEALQITPRIGDVVFTVVERLDESQPEEHFYFAASGPIVFRNETYNKCIFRNLHHNSAQVHSDLSETRPSHVTFIEGVPRDPSTNQHLLEDKTNKIHSLSQATDTQHYTSAKALDEVNTDLNGKIEDEEAARIQGDADTLETADEHADTKIATHNTSSSAHQDIRTALSTEASTRASEDARYDGIADEREDTKISTHNTSESAHSFIQGLISTLSTAFNNFKNLITSYIMSGTSATNQLTNVSFVNSSIASETANYIANPDTHDVWNSLTDLKNYTTESTVGNNDYAVVQTQVTTKGKKNADPQYKFDRYKFTVGSTPYKDGWAKEYTLHPGFTEAQWNALMSGATATKIAQIATNTSNIATLDSDKADKATTINGHALSSDVTVTKGDVGLGNVNNTSDLNKPISTATQAALDDKQDTLTAGTEISLSSNTVAFSPTSAHSAALDSGATSTKIGSYDTHVAKKHVYSAQSTDINATIDPWVVVYADGTEVVKNTLVGSTPTTNRKQEKKITKVVKKIKKKITRKKKASKK